MDATRTPMTEPTLRWPARLHPALMPDDNVKVAAICCPFTQAGE